MRRGRRSDLQGRPASGTASGNVALLLCASSVSGRLHCCRVQGLRLDSLCRVLVTEHAICRASRADQSQRLFSAQIAQAL